MCIFSLESVCTYMLAFKHALHIYRHVCTFTHRMSLSPCAIFWRTGLSCGKADATALHADLETVGGLAAGVHNAAVHVTGAVAVVSQVVCAAAAAASL